ncbi:putative alpha-L-fucosidase [Helianthus debilis subsp. tardiflorus]
MTFRLYKQCSNFKPHLLLILVTFFTANIPIKMEPISSKLLVYVILLLPISILSLSECYFPAVFNFGDSNSDTGALSSMFGQAAAPPPNGETFFGSPSGRVCDGRLIIDFIVSHHMHEIQREKKGENARVR